MKNITLVLDNIRSTHNVGSIFRTADSFGVSNIILGGITPGPIDKYGRKRTDIAKVALGAEDTLPYQIVHDIASFLKNVKQECPQVQIFCLEQALQSVSLFDCALGKVGVSADIILVVGNEVDGVSKEVLAICDTIVEIPQMGKKESLNVSVATGSALFAFRLLDSVQ